MSSEILDGIEVSVIDGLHEIPKIEKASLQLTLIVASQNVLTIGPERHSGPRGLTYAMFLRHLLI